MPEAPGGDLGTLDQTVELLESNFGVDHPITREGSKTGIGRCYYPFATDDAGKPLKSFGHHFGMLDVVRGHVDNARY